MATEYVVRVSFGTALIASIVLVYTTIIAILSSSRYNFSTLHKHFMSIINYMHSMHSHILISNINSFLFLRCATVKRTIVEGEEDLMIQASCFT